MNTFKRVSTNPKAAWQYGEGDEYILSFFLHLAFISNQRITPGDRMNSELLFNKFGSNYKALIH